jgi:hypothetical protein
MCTHARVGRLGTTLRQLGYQQGCSVSLYIWNNNSAESARIRKIIAQSPARIETYVYDSRENIGGYGRFLIARDLAVPQEPVLFIDDDAHLESDAVSCLLDEYEPALISSFWAFRFNTLHSFYSRIRVRPGAAADLCGTAGAICASSLFADPGMFQCPPRYRRLEDMWLSFFAMKNGFKLIASACRIRLIVDGLDSSWRFPRNEFYRFLVMNGWPIGVSGRTMSDQRDWSQRPVSS